MNLVQRNETIEHLLMECPANAEERRELLTKVANILGRRRDQITADVLLARADDVPRAAGPLILATTAEFVRAVRGRV